MKGKPFQKGHQINLGRKMSEETKRKIGLKNSISQKGKKLSEITRKKMSLSRIGFKHSIETRTRMSEIAKKNGVGKWMKGKKKTIKDRKAISERQSGERSNWWKGGITPLNKIIRRSGEMKLWREAVFARDNWTCQKTGIKGGKLHPHHIQNFSQFPELRFAIDNGITLSEKSHREFHNIYGKKNNNREQLEEFLK